LYCDGAGAGKFAGKQDIPRSMRPARTQRTASAVRRRSTTHGARPIMTRLFG